MLVLQTHAAESILQSIAAANRFMAVDEVVFDGRHRGGVGRRGWRTLPVRQVALLVAATVDDGCCRIRSAQRGSGVRLRALGLGVEAAGAASALRPQREVGDRLQDRMLGAQHLDGRIAFGEVLGHEFGLDVRRQQREGQLDGDLAAHGADQQLHLNVIGDVDGEHVALFGRVADDGGG